MEAWRDMKHWVQVQYRMSEAEVLELLGHPHRAEESGYERRTYWYGQPQTADPTELRKICGRVQFVRDGPRDAYRVREWETPKFALLPDDEAS